MRRARWLTSTIFIWFLLAATSAESELTKPTPCQPGPLNNCWQASSTFLRSEQFQENLEPMIWHQAWEDAAVAKLTRFEGVLDGDGNPTRKPNMLIIYVDDMGWGDPGVYGGGPALGAPTPNIDALAAAGLRMTSAYSQPACTPTRAAWQTGQLPQRNGLTRPTAAGEPEMGLSVDTKTLPRLLRQQGYMTGMAGKWHLGEAEGSWPTDVGYEKYYGNLGVNTAYHDWRDKNFSPELVFDKERVDAMWNLGFLKTSVRSVAGADDTMGETVSYEPYELIDLDCDNNDQAELAKHGITIDDVDLTITDSCEQELEYNYLNWSKSFIDEATEANQPFFLYHAMNRVHTKNYPSAAFEGKSPASTPFRDGMMEIDYVVGKLIEHLETEGLLENTFIFFTSDNGAEEDVHAGGINTSDSGHHPWRGAKGTTWEGGVRVSAIARWDGMIQAGRVSDGLFDHMDLFNTLARLGGINFATFNSEFPASSGVYIDGVDQTSWLLRHTTPWSPDRGEPIADNDDPDQTSNREAIFYWYGQDFYGVRWAEYKRMERIMNVGMSVGPQTYGGLFNATKSETSDPTMGWFFNLYSDPKERMPITRTWNIATLNELSGRSKLTFLNYPTAPRGVIIDGEIIGGEGTRSFKGKKDRLDKLKRRLATRRIHASALPD